MTYIDPFATIIDVLSGDRDPEELRALARMIVFARQNAIDLDLQNAVHCLDLALRSVLQESDSSMDGLTFRECDLDRLRAH
jgi:hypothetical protein